MQEPKRQDPLPNVRLLDGMNPQVRRAQTPECLPELGQPASRAEPGTRYGDLKKWDPLVSPRRVRSRIDRPFVGKRRVHHGATVSLLTRSVVEDEHDSASEALGEVVGELVSEVGHNFLFGLDSPRKKVGV
jgi:hypothetical protein